MVCLNKIAIIAMCVLVYLEQNLIEKITIIIIINIIIISLIVTVLLICNNNMKCIASVFKKSMID